MRDSGKEVFLSRSTAAQTYMQQWNILFTHAHTTMPPTLLQRDNRTILFQDFRGFV